MLSVLSSYALAHDICQSSVDQLRWAIVSYEKFLKRPPTPADFSRDFVNAWIRSLIEEKKQARSGVKSKRTAMLQLWRHAFEEGLVQEQPRKIRPVNVPRGEVLGWTKEEIEHLWATAYTLAGKLPNGIERSLFFGAFVPAKYDVGLRLADVLSIERGWIFPDGHVTIVMHKTKECIRRFLQPTTMAAIDATFTAKTRNRRLIFPGWGRRDFFEEFKNLVAAAGLEGTTKFIRRSSATYAELQQPGGGSLQCGHKTPGLFEQHYRVDRIMGRTAPQPPALTGPILDKT
jgi:hypothetical protein